MIAPRSAIAAGKLAMRGPSAAASSTLSSTAALAHGRRAFSSSRSALANTLLFVEHKKGKLNPTSLSAVTAAQKLGGDVHAVVVGSESEVEAAADQVTKCVPLSLENRSTRA
jgi:electron transfer flavoprotein alpha subunit